jgi:hypothetical protein
VLINQLCELPVQKHSKQSLLYLFGVLCSSSNYINSPVIKLSYQSILYLTGGLCSSTDYVNSLFKNFLNIRFNIYLEICALIIQLKEHSVKKLSKQSIFYLSGGLCSSTDYICSLCYKTFLSIDFVFNWRSFLINRLYLLPVQKHSKQSILYLFGVLCSSSNCMNSPVIKLSYQSILYLSGGLCSSTDYVNSLFKNFPNNRFNIYLEICALIGALY